MKEIDKIALIYLKDGKILSTLSKGKDTYYIPGGKREGNESDIETLIRECKEELTIDIVQDSVKYYGTFEAQAHGKVEGILVRMICYTAEFKGEIKPSSEIQEIRWLDYGNLNKISPVDKLIFKDLYEKELLGKNIMIQGKDYIGVGCGAFIVNDNNELLLQLRNKAPEKEYWCIPGGRVELFEKMEDTVKREVMEETGVEIEIIDLLGICNHIVENENVHWMSPSFLCKIVKGVPEIKEPTKHLDLKWFKLDNLPEKLTITTKVAVDNYNKYIEKKVGK